MRKPTAVIIGYGRMGREHERAYQECGIDVVMRCNSEAVDYVKSLKPDYVSVCSYDDSHADYICATLEAGCKVIAEKPLCLTEDDLKRIYKLATPDNLYCNLPLLNQDWPDASKKQLIHATYDWGSDRVQKIHGWRSQCPGYSFVLGAGVHITSLLLHIKGRAIEYVTASGQKNVLGIDCETDIAASGRFVGGDKFEFGIWCGKNAGPHHFHGLWLHNTDGLEGDISMHIKNMGSDKTAGIKRFIEGKYDRYHNSFAAHSVCFAIERALKSGKRETVSYLS